MLAQLTAALPPLETESPTANALRHEVARAMVIAAHPADPIEAALAISAAIAYQASLASNALAASPGLTSVQSNRYARTAIAQDHAFRAGVAALAKHRGAIAQPATPKRARAASPAGSEPEQQMIDDDPVPQLPQFQPRARHGNPIPLYRFRDMTPLQRRTTYGDPYDTAGWAAATAEEDIAIAAQKAEDEAAKPTT
jgi:hypothetical protein